MRKNSGNILLIILAVAGILAASWGDIFSGPQNSSASDTRRNKTRDETTSWKTYTGPYFSLKYPPDWADPKEKQLDQQFEINFKNKPTVSSGFYFDKNKNLLTFAKYVQKICQPTGLNPKITLLVTM